MQREKSVKAKEVIEGLIKFLSALEFDSVPCAETFRRAKFNKHDVVQNMWDLLHNLLVKAVQLECKCQHSRPGAKAWFVRSALWHCGYGARWVVAPQAGSCCGDAVGSRELLLAFGWMLSSGSLLEFLLGERVLQMQPLAVPPAQVCIPGAPLVDLCEGGKGKECVCRGTGGDGDGDLRRLQWEHGKLRHRWRSLLAAQEERAKLIHKVLSDMGSRPVSPSSAALGTSDASPLSKELENTKRVNHLLEAYLQWKVLEPLFWRWMESVIDSQSADPCEEDTAPTPGGPGGPAGPFPAQGSCSGGDWVRRTQERLEALRLQTQTSLQARRDGSSPRRGHGGQGRRHSTSPAADSDGKFLEDDRQVVTRLQGFSAASTPASVDNGFIPCLHVRGRPAPHHPKLEPSKHTPHGPEPPGKLQASEVIQELRAREAFLLGELEVARRANREALQEQASGLEGVIFIPPPKRCHTPP
ncbi:tubulin epsilon and delta complex protein 1 isoform X2 [Sardina pilchardus]|uniref:tubulin epsilon and delta complex protein 1 isoform X2 n=1 Tax=Sardina pilchardus TaxID=27697 RepID=UPI002E146A33